MSKYLWDKEKLQKAITEGISYSDVLRRMNIPTAGNNQSTLKRKIKEFNLDISHFTFRREKKNESKQIPIDDYLNNKKFIKTSDLKEKLIKAGLKLSKCEKCGISEWQGAPLVIQLHHINGNSKNNNLNNLQLLCPNCHSQTDNYCGNSNKQPKQKYYCPDCGREIHRRSTRCLSCASKFRGQTKFNLSKEELQGLLEQGYSRTQIGKNLGVTEACIRKWIKKYNI